MPETLSVRPAYTLTKGDRIKFLGGEVTIQSVDQNGDWTTLYFETLVWNPYTEKWVLEYGCHFGFCFQTIK